MIAHGKMGDAGFSQQAVHVCWLSLCAALFSLFALLPFFAPGMLESARQREEGLYGLCTQIHRRKGRLRVGGR